MRTAGYSGILLMRAYRYAICMRVSVVCRLLYVRRMLVHFFRDVMNNSDVK